MLRPAAQLLAAMPDEWASFLKVYVLMDSGFCNPTVCSAVREKKFHFICAAQSTRNFWVERGRRKAKKVKLATHTPGILRYQGHNLELEPKRPGGKKRAFRLATQTGTMKGIGRIRCGIFSASASVRYAKL